MSLHLFKEYQGGDVYLARDETHAKELWTRDTGLPGTDNEWGRIPDEAEICVEETWDEEWKTAVPCVTASTVSPAPKARRVTAGQYASECSEAGCVGSFE